MRALSCERRSQAQGNHDARDDRPDYRLACQDRHSDFDLTGGAPEMIPDFRYFIERVKGLQPSRHVIDRCNLTILLQPGYEDLPGFLARHRVEIIASMPCYTPENVNAQ